MIKNLFLNYFAQKDSAVARYLASSISAGIVYLITKFVPPSIWILTPDQELVIATGTLLVVNNIINEFVTSIQAKNAEKVQQVINKAETKLVPTVHTDGRIGNVTLDAVKSLVAVANSTLPSDTKVTTEVKNDIKEKKSEINV